MTKLKLAASDGRPVNWTGRGRGSDTGGGNPPGGDDLEKRVEALEKSIPDLRERLARVETKLDNTATKTDIAELKTLIAEGFGSQTKWYIGTAIGLAVIAFTAARFIPGG